MFEMYTISVHSQKAREPGFVELCQEISGSSSIQTEINFAKRQTDSVSITTEVFLNEVYHIVIATCDD